MRKSKLLKAISYVLIPILLLIIGISIFYNIGKDSFTNNPENEENFFESDIFLNMYMGTLSDKASNLIYKNDRYNKLQDGENEIFYEDRYSDDSYYDYIKDFYYLIQYKNLYFTNVELTEETNTIQEIQSYIVDVEGKKATILNGKVTATASIIENKALQYFNSFDFKYYSINPTGAIDDESISIEYSKIEEDAKYNSDSIENVDDRIKEYHTTTINDFQIYSTYQEERIINKSEQILKQIVIMLEPYEKIMLVALPISTILFIIFILYLIISVGHSKNKDEIDLNDFDRIPIEIIYLACSMIFALFIVLPIGYLQYNNSEVGLFISLACASYFLAYVSVILPFITTIKRLKAKCFWKTTLIGIIWKKLWKKLIKIVKGTYNDVTKSWNKTVKLFLILIGYALLSVLLIALFSGFGLVIATGIGAYLVYKFNERINCYEKIEIHLKEMYEGNHSTKLNYQDFTPEFQEMVKYINDVSSGFENAIQEGIKSERLKTELITNVSHDIKTPLTSIINYVDLLKKEDIQDEKAREYIDILENKSQRLKKLTEDLVEASKASSGNVKLNIEKINIAELVKQTTGEFEDKFNSKNLDVVVSVPNEVLYINADNRYMYRIIENLFSNISKYALDGSRVYIDVKKEEDKAKIYIKNISKERLNISAEELMQRFVRGDKSRTTEGSGLGISISKSLTEIQNGTFELQVDGDLFKVVLEFYII